ncbi:hypothetical protein P3W45_001139 [Vairimorpha bombi]|jgi:hypothetical protein
MIILNDLFNYKPLKIYKTYTEYLENTDTEDILDTNDEDYYIQNIKTSYGKNLYHYGMYFVIKYYLNKSENINKKIECINALIERFLKEPNGHTYDILKYLVIDLDIESVIGIFTKDKILSLFIGEYCIRNEISLDIFLENLGNLFYVFIPYYFYKNPVSITHIVDKEPRLLFLFSDYLDTDYRVQYYIENVLGKYELEIDGYILKVNTDFEISPNKYNPYTYHLLIKNNINIDYEFSTELMILNYKIKSFIIEDTDICTKEAILYNKVIKWYHGSKDSSVSDQDIKYLLRNDDIDKQIIDKYRLVNNFKMNDNIDKQIIDKYRLVNNFKMNDSFSMIINEFALNELLKTNKEYDIETLMNLRENFFNTMIYKENAISNKYTWKGELISNEIIDLIKKYHISKLQTKRYLDNLYDKIMENKYKNIFIVYLLNRHVRDHSIFIDCLCNGNKDRRLNLVDKYFMEYFCNEPIQEVKNYINSLRIEECTCGMNYYLSYVYRNQKEMYSHEIAKRFKEYLINQNKKEIYSNIDNILPDKENISNNIPKRYKININKSKIRDDKIEEVKESDVASVLCLRRYIKTRSYKSVVKKFVVDYEYITMKYKSTNYKFIKYVTDSHAKNIISDLILYDIDRLNRLVNNGFVLKENYIKEVLNRLKKEGDLSVIKTIRNILQKNDKLHLYSMIIYEDLDFYGKNVVLEYIKISDSHEMMRMLVILNNEDNLNLVIKILNIIRMSIKYLEILDKYKNNYKFTKLMVRAYPLLNNYNIDIYNEICSNYKYKEEIELMKKYHKIK